ncbi:type IV secretory system conjugative DNA transfer family protein [Thermophilibacter sp.]
MTETILAHDRALSCDTRATGLNNNLLVLGPSGSGKTRHVLKPNLLQMGSSFLVLDTKGLLCREVGPVLAAHGYDVQRVDFTDLDGAAGAQAGPRDAAVVGYNPLAHIRRDPVTGVPVQQDVISVASSICPTELGDDPFWEHAAANYLTCCIAYALEELPPAEQHLGSVARLVEEMGDGMVRLMAELEVSRPDSYALSVWRRISASRSADKTNGSIMAILAEKLMCLAFGSAVGLYTRPRQADFARMGHERVALFVTVSDTDRSLDPLTSLFVTQALRCLMREADRCPEGRLPVPVRLMLDDFSNLRIPGFADAIAVLRSREVWCTLLLQTVSQLEERYGDAGARTIVGNCDAQLVLGFQDTQTATAYAERADRPASRLLATPLDRAWLFVRGRVGEQVRRYELEDHPLYGEMRAAELAARRREAVARHRAREAAA